MCECVDLIAIRRGQETLVVPILGTLPGEFDQLPVTSAVFHRVRHFRGGVAGPLSGELGFGNLLITLAKRRPIGNGYQKFKACSPMDVFDELAREMLRVRYDQGAVLRPVAGCSGPSPSAPAWPRRRCAPWWPS